MKKECNKKVFNLTEQELKILKKLNTPRKIQDFLDKLKINFEEKGETCMSPRRVLREKQAHCIEAALLAYLAFKIQGKKSYLLDLKTTKDDFEHVLCLFKEKGKYGAISKTNHYCLRYREPVYKNIRELAMSFFHEYFNDNGEKTLRSFSMPITLKKFGWDWVTEEKELWKIHDYLDKIRHFPILDKNQSMRLRKADKIEIEAGKIAEWEKLK